MHTTEWTIDRVRDELPDVPVRDGSRIVLGRIRGRKLPFPTVYIGSMDDTRGAQFSWDAIVRTLNNPNGALRF